MMGTRTRGIADHHVPDEIRREPPRVLPILSASTPECLAVEQYWRAHDPGHKPDQTSSWSVFERGGDDLNRWWFDGPGCMSIRFGPQVAEVFAGARWRGFRTIPALRQVRRTAFAAIGRAVGATGILFVPCYAEELFEAADDGKSFGECLRLMEDRWGPVQGDLDDIRPGVIADCERCPPQVWYLEPL
jgi:hypothetical protein